MEYWVLEWSVSDDYAKKERQGRLLLGQWNGFHLDHSDFEYALNKMLEHVNGERTNPGWLQYNWRIRDLHSGEIIPGNIL